MKKGDLIIVVESLPDWYWLTYTTGHVGMITKKRTNISMSCGTQSELKLWMNPFLQILFEENPVNYLLYVNVVKTTKGSS